MCSGQKTTAKDRHMQCGFKVRKPTAIYAKGEHVNFAIESEYFLLVTADWFCPSTLLAPFAVR